ncbi:MAG: hypothetical protein WA913_13555 [Pricia sp.]
MKKLVYSLMMIFALSLSVGTLNSCREDKSAGEKMEDAGEDMEDAAEDVGNDVEDAAEDAGDEMEDAVDDN